MAKRTRGRQRIEMKRMQNENHLQVSFSRRRLGLFKAANEMSILTGSQIALIVFSPNKIVYPFGSPDVWSVIERFERQSYRQPLVGHHMLVDFHAQANQLKLNSEFSLLQNKVEALKKQRNLLDQMIEKQKSEYWLESLILELDAGKLKELLKAMKEPDREVMEKIDIMLASSSQQRNTCGFDYLPSHDDCSAVLNSQAPSNFSQDTAHPPGLIHGFSSNSPLASFDSRTLDCNQNAAVPSIIYSGEVNFDSGDSRIASVVECAGSLSAFGMISGESTSNPMAP